MKLALVLLCLCCRITVSAQARLMERIFTVTPRENMTASLVQDDYRSYLRARREARDRFIWHTWQINTGPRAGGFTGGTFGRLLEEFDSENSVNNSLAFYFPTAKIEDNAFFVGLPGLGRNPFWEESPPTNFVEVRYFRIAPGKESAFEGILATTREAYIKGRQPRNYAVYRLYNGGPQTIFILWVPLEKLSDMQYPDRGPTAVLDFFINSQDVAPIIQSTHSELLRYRADLSYTPSV